MKTAEATIDSSSLHARITAADASLRHHRLQTSRMAEALELHVRRRITSPAALALAAGLGFLLEKRRHHPSPSLLNLLKTATHASLLVRALQ